MRAHPFFVLALAATAAAQSPPIQLPELHAPATVVRDRHGVPHVYADDERDAYLLCGYVHAQDRLFQMDFLRRQARGTLAELFGAAALESDVQLRTLGIARAAAASEAALSPRAATALQAYAAGVNAWVARHALPPEYGALELLQFAPWTPGDCVAIAKLQAFGLSFVADFQATLQLLTYQAAGQALGFDGTGLNSDLYRSDAATPYATVPDWLGATSSATAGHGAGARAGSTAAMAERCRQRASRTPLLARLLDPARRPGSNAWVVHGSRTDTGRPFLASDPHLGAELPSMLHPIHVVARATDLDVMGEAFAGLPLVLMGHNRDVAWAPTNNYADVTDMYSEVVVPDPTSPSGLSTLYLGMPEHIVPIPEEYRANQPGNQVPDDVVVVPPGNGIPPVTLIAPRHGPIIDLDPQAGTALSVQWAGAAPTREIDCFLQWHSARGLNEFRAGLRNFDVGAQNWVYADVDGHIGYFASGEVPLREDLQAGTVHGAPPWFVRDGTGGNEWLPPAGADPHRALPFAILPEAEMPFAIDPPCGYLVTANNDPIGLTLDNDALNTLRPGGGILYFTWGYTSFRAATIARRLQRELAHGRLTSLADQESIQGDNEFADARFFVPVLAEAWRRASRPGAAAPLRTTAQDPRVVEAVGRLLQWDFTSPTGLRAGFDPGHAWCSPRNPSPSEVRRSAAATLYAVWRARLVANTMDVPFDAWGLPKPDDGNTLNGLRHLLADFAVGRGVGQSGLDFFAVPGVGVPEDRRDVIVLRSLAEALDQLAGPAYAAAFGGSTDQSDYRWGRLSRISFRHPLGGPFDAPPAFGWFPSPLADLEGIPVDGNATAVDNLNQQVRADGSESFRAFACPARRVVAEVGPRWSRVRWSLPGGASGVPGDRHYVDQLAGFLANDYVDLPYQRFRVLLAAETLQVFAPGP
ncbi:MAG: penicillin acylase family protein [Planctomycetes bacterium]|nr:penicillin acylase family protein [Planctomycetota bacterium]